MTPKEALAVIFSFIKKEPVVVATGYLSRTAQAVADRPANFYMIGSMGMVSSVALGAALAKPKTKIIALDGDGAVLMNLGNPPMVGALKTENFIHIVIDNESYESTGSQPSYSASVKLEAIAKSAGYRAAKRVTGAAALKREMPKLLSQKGPSFLLVRVDVDSAPAAPRIAATPEAITEKFSECLQ